MDSASLAAWLGLALTFLIAAGCLVAWFINHTSELKKDMEIKFKEQIDQERTDRKEAIDEIKTNVKALSELAVSVASMSKSVEHLTERTAEQSKALSEVKNYMQNLDQKLQGVTLQVASKPRTRSPRTKASSRASNHS